MRWCPVGRYGSNSCHHLNGALVKLDVFSFSWNIGAVFRDVILCSNRDFEIFSNAKFNEAIISCDHETSYCYQKLQNKNKDKFEITFKLFLSIIKYSKNFLRNNKSNWGPRVSFIGGINKSLALIARKVVHKPLKESWRFVAKFIWNWFYPSFLWAWVILQFIQHKLLNYFEASKSAINIFLILWDGKESCLPIRYGVLKYI